MNLSIKRHFDGSICAEAWGGTVYSSCSGPAINRTVGSGALIGERSEGSQNSIAQVFPSN